MGLWSSSDFSENAIKDSWSKLADELCSVRNIIGVDLYQEPYNAVWGYPGTAGQTLNWNLAAERQGNHVLSKCQRWLVFVQGISGWPGSFQQPKKVQSFYGENLRGARAAPIKLSNPQKLVYTPHICAHSDLARNTRAPL